MMDTRRVAAITPDEVRRHKAESLPDAVIEVFNELIAERWDGYRAMVRQCDVVARIVAKTGETQQGVFDRHWLDVEDLYRKAGWSVDYDKPGFNESYEATFIFRKKRGSGVGED